MVFSIPRERQILIENGSFVCKELKKLLHFKKYELFSSSRFRPLIGNDRNINAMRCPLETLVGIFNLHAKSLKEVYIWGHLTPHSLKLPSQTLYALEELRFHMCLFPVAIFRFTPNLRKVCLSHKNISKNESTTEPDFKVNTCKELDISCNSFWGERCDLGFDILLSFFPNVEALDARGLNNRQFSVVCEYLTKLVTLNCPCTSKSDVTGLLGYDPESQTNNVDRNPNITNLKGLESFSAVLDLSWKDTEETCMRDGGIILKELESLIHLKKFELKENKEGIRSGRRFLVNIRTNREACWDLIVGFNLTP